jgi:hypothetical protein
MRIAWLVSMATVLVFAAGCVSTSKANRYETPLDLEPFAPYAQEGTASIRGQAYLESPTGEVKYAVRDEIVLVPVTDYTREWFDRGVVQGENVPPLDPRVGPYFRLSETTGEGKFAFLDLPAGSYYVVTDINWESQQGQVVGGTAYAEVTVAAGENAEVAVTRP